MAQPIRRKISLSTSLSPKIGKMIDNAMEGDDYASQSDLIQVALTTYFTLEEQRERERKMARLYEVLIRHPEGQAVLREVQQSTQEKIDACVRAGNALTELGEYEEAQKYFAKAKELESGQPLEQEKEQKKEDTEKTKIYFK